MTVRDWYREALQHNYYSLILLIEFLVYEKKTINLQDPEQALNFYMQERFKDKMNAYLLAYEQIKLGNGVNNLSK
ncbi:hypothetical protein P8891_13445 [Bacillus atrophaeus]|uniref:hypothetical protein n=1 Tax=Bacillus atrophaeus TaxID=1452 RepID=UPI00227E5330|nr:hypothetical protein [Bacillus atrophaeus]MCY7947334.1 hypothetical protein [Bacillus atrophaeus]MCY9168098.1 hypothetical protein [Bacillus atrophaeus]MEC0742038.1 hypothetical protein [Bacillus atrophaeus]MEC0744648.1 hypothetical protein [Bacillus atrophaeus]MEC0757638.1 hypothetical protein [Bacillus atrophaeus]